MSVTVDISVVMGSYNQCETLKTVLTGYLTQEGTATFEVIVVDSTSTDGTSEMMKSFDANFKFTPIIQENNGKAAARNRGVSEASGDLIIITDSDMIPDPAFIQTHVDAQRQLTEPGCFEGVTYNMIEEKWPCTEDNLMPYIQEKLKPNQKLGFHYFLTGNISFPKALFESFGGFDESFKSYGWEDLELGYRMSLKKVPLRYLPAAKNYHYHVITKEEEIERCIAKGESAKRFLAKHPNLKWFLGLNPVTVFLFKTLDWDGAVVRFFRRRFACSSDSISHKVGFLFLKEHYYFRGLIGR